MSAADSDLSKAIEAQSQFRRRLYEQASPDERLARFAELQRQSFRLLETSPDGWSHFLRRNLQSRRVEVIDGKWRPVSPYRRSY